MSYARPLFALVVISSVLTLAPKTAGAQAPPASVEKPATSKQDFDAQSVALRTALHHDPTLDAPLERLAAMYRAESRIEELLGIYRTHLAQYPDDASGTTVLVRLLVTLGDPEAARAARTATERFPQHAFLRYLHYQVLRGRSDPKALDELDRAIELETQPARKLAWVDLLLPAAVVEDRRAPAKKHLDTLAALVSDAEGRLEVARKMNKYKFHDQALELLQKAAAASPSPETMVATEMEAATAEVGLNRMDMASARLDRLLAKLAPDYWQRGEILLRRLALVKSPAEQEAMIQAARKRLEKAPSDEAAALDLARILSGFELPREALAALQDAGRRGLNTERIEKQVLELFDRLHDEPGREAYLARRIREQPERKDLLILHVRSLYGLGKRAEALAEFTAALEKLEAQDKRVQLLEMARALRRASLPADAAELYRRVIDLEPARLDVRRELAETYLAMGQRERVREVLSKAAYLQAEVENFLDLVQFMIQQELLPEAKAAVTQRLARDKEDLELSLLLLSIEQRLGNASAGDDLIQKGRRLSDTGARYRRWLEAAAAFCEAFETKDKFLQAEEDRLEQEPKEWTAQRVERRLAYVEVAARSGRRAEAAAMIERDLAASPPADVRSRLRRQLIAAMDTASVAVPSPGSGVPLDVDRQKMLAQLESLAKDDPQFADEANARLALLHARNERGDLAAQLLAKIDVTRIQDPAILNALRTLYPQYRNDPRAVVAILERLTVVNPTDRLAWEQWVAALAVQGDETRLSSAIRRLLAGVPNMPLSDPTRQLLQAHLADSHWRSVAQRATEGQEAALADALPLLDSVERIAQDDAQRLWITWIRAYVLHRLGRKPARDAAIVELQRQVALLHKTPKPPADPQKPGDEAPPAPGPAEPPRIAFPEGLTVSLEQARKLLTSAPEAPAPPAVSPRQGPAGELKTQWAFDTSTGAAVTTILPVGESRVLIGDASRTLYCLDAATGRLLWQREDVLPLSPPLQEGGPYSGYDLARSGRLKGPELAADDQGRFYVPGSAEVSCYAVDDGRLLWQSRVGAVGTAFKAPSVPVSSPLPVVTPCVSIFLAQGHVVTYEPASGTVAKIDPGTGKIVWELSVAAAQPAMIGPHNSGASLSGKRLLVYGARTAILDLEKGEVEWSFEPWRVRPFPVKLPDPSAPSPSSTAGAASSYPGSVGYPPGMSPAYPVVSYGPSYAPGYYPGGVVYRSGYVRSYPSSYVTYPGYPSPYGPAAQPAVFVDYSQPLRGGLPSGEMCLSGPAVVWAALDRQGVPRQAALVGPWVLLLDPSGISVVRTDLPLGGKRLMVQAALVGVSGRTACLVSGNELLLVDVADGTARRFGLQDQPSPSPYPLPVTAVVDGPLVYVSGPRGILCLNARTAQRVFQADWPKDLASAAASSTPSPSSPLAPSPYAATPGVSYVITSSPYGPSSGMAVDPYGRRIVPSGVLRVGPGRIYATPSPSRVAALKERAADGR